MSQQIFLGLNQMALVDDDDHEWLKQCPWWSAPSGHAITTLINNGWLQDVLMARAITNALPDEKVVQVNPANRLDYRKCNLKVISPRRGIFHHWIRPKILPGLRGVGWSWLRRRYHVVVEYRGQHYDLGYYQDYVTAGMAFDAAARQLAGLHAACNFPARPTPPELAEKVAALLAKQQNGS